MILLACGGVVREWLSFWNWRIGFMPQPLAAEVPKRW
jgi:hypothetical protein